MSLKSDADYRRFVIYQPPMKAVQLSSISKSFGSVPVLNNITLDVEEGEFFFLLGPSGCGKTTLLRLIAGFITPDSGTLALFGKDISNVPPEDREISMVFQNYALWPHMSVAQNIAFGLEMRGVLKSEIRDRVTEALELTRIGQLGERYPQELSGGQQQRVALARALVVTPKLILLDEPLSNLDAKLRLEMRRELRSLHERLGRTMIYVTHDQGEALALGTRIALLNSGRVAQVGTPQEVLSSPADQFVREFMGQTALLKGRVETLEGHQEIRFTSGALPASEGEDLVSGQSVSLAIRPENVIVLRNKPQ